MPRLKQVSRAKAPENVRKYYEALFVNNPVAVVTAEGRPLGGWRLSTPVAGNWSVRVGMPPTTWYSIAVERPTNSAQPIQRLETEEAK